MRTNLVLLILASALNYEQAESLDVKHHGCAPASKKCKQVERQGPGCMKCMVREMKKTGLVSGCNLDQMEHFCYLLVFNAAERRENKESVQRVEHKAVKSCSHELDYYCARVRAPDTSAACTTCILKHLKRTHYGKDSKCSAVEMARVSSGK